ncbi:MAG: TIGR03986 family CRISPR-associated RAMP protein [Bacteroidales bacterium]|nr:TIGR03986 family CRISPR-associated RAMP protein [Bacteroidales bacterium]
MASWNIDDKKRFVNPYQFAPIDFSENPKREACATPEVDRGRDAAQRATFSPDSDLLTGYIECALYPVGDMFIPNTSNDKIFGGKIMDGQDYHKEYDFYSYDDLSEVEKSKDSGGPSQPIIPASSIRGVIRSVYECLTNSCLSVLSDEPLSSRGIPLSHVDVQKKPGLIKKEQGRFVLYSTTRYALPIKNYGKRSNFTIEAKFDKEKGKTVKVLKVAGLRGREYRSGDKVTFSSLSGNRVGKITGDDASSGKEGFLYLGEKISQKKNESVFVLGEPVKETSDEEVLKKAIELYKTSLAEYYQNEGVNKSLKKLEVSDELEATDADKQSIHYGYADLNIDTFDWDDPEKAYPVWYEIIGGNLYLSPAMYGRNVFYRTERNFFAAHAPCTEESHLCPACRLFGFVSETESGEAKTSHLQFTDAKLKPDSSAKYQKPVAIQELSGPKTSSVEFYTRPIGERWDKNWDTVKSSDRKNHIWNYDWRTFYQGTDQEEKERKRPQNKAFDATARIEARGRKFYWHDLTRGKYRTEAKTKRNCTIRPLRGCLTDKEVDDSFNQFQFRVYFDRISADELTAMLLSLSLGTETPRLAHKLGHGKPIGLGSTKIVVSDVVARTLNFIENGGTPEVRYEMVPIFSEDSYQFFAKRAFDDFLRIGEDVEKTEELLANINARNSLLSKDRRLLCALIRLMDTEIMVKQNVSYPLGENARAENKDMKESSANWFIGNRSLGGSEMAPAFNYILPDVNAADQSLPSFYYGDVKQDAPVQEVSVVVTVKRAKPPAKQKKRSTGVIVDYGKDLITIRVDNSDVDYRLETREKKAIDRIFKNRKKSINKKITFSEQPVNVRGVTHRIVDIERA